MLLASGNDLPCQSQRDCLIQNSPNKVIMVQLSNSQSTDAPVTLCDRYAAFPFDPAKKTPGVSYSQLDAASAISQCQIAVKEFPQTSRLYFQLGRGLEKGRRLPEAISAYQTAANLGHGGGFNNLGELYRDGKGVSKDLKMAEVYFRKGSDINYAEAQYNLAILLLKIKNTDSNTALARDLLSAALQSGYADAKKPLDMLPVQQPKLALGVQVTVAENPTLVEDDTAISNARPDDYEVDSVVPEGTNQNPIEKFKQAAKNLSNQCLRGNIKIGTNRIFGVNTQLENIEADTHQCALSFDDVGFYQKVIDPRTISSLRSVISSGLWKGIEVSQGKFLTKFDMFGPSISDLDMMKPYNSNSSGEVCLEALKDKDVPWALVEPEKYIYTTSLYCASNMSISQYTYNRVGTSPQTFRSLTKDQKPCIGFRVGGFSYCETMFLVTKIEYEK